MPLLLYPVSRPHPYGALRSPAEGWLPARGRRVRQLLHDRSNFSVTTGKPAAVPTDRHLPREGWAHRASPIFPLVATNREV